MLTMNRSRLERNAAAEVISRTAPGRGALTAAAADEAAGEPDGGVDAEVAVEAVAVGGLLVEPVEEQPELLDQRLGVVLHAQLADEPHDRLAGLREVAVGDSRGGVGGEVGVVGELGEVVAERAPAAVAGHRRGDLLDEGHELLARVVPGGVDRAAGGGGPPFVRPGEVRGDEVGLRREVPVEQVLAGPGLGDDLVHPHRADAVLVEEPGRDPEDAVPGARGGWSWHASDGSGPIGPRHGVRAAGSARTVIVVTWGPGSRRR